MIVVSGELLVSPAILVGVWLFLTPKSESLIWFTISSLLSENWIRKAILRHLTWFPGAHPFYSMN